MVMFKVGDKVKCIKSPYGPGGKVPQLDGVYLIKDIYVNGFGRYFKLFEDPTGLDWSASRFVLYEEDDFSNLDLSLDI